MPPEPDDEQRWRRWYVVVLGTMAALVALFAFLTAHYNR
jgi:hypothetical protein